MGYVPQDDIVHPHLAVRENLLFSARIRLGGILKDKEIQQNVDLLVQALGLTEVKDSLVGDYERRGVSGGECKRISIGLELIAAPRVLILDEPTSGLDAQAALSIITLLKALSKRGITIICVLHQPRIEIFNSLDTLLLLGSGRQVYFGKRSDSERYFKDKGYEFDPQLNPADVILDIIGDSLRPSYSSPVGIAKKEETALSGLEKALQISNNSEMLHISSRNENLTVEQLIGLHHLHRKRMSPWYRQLYLCFSRDILQQSRDISTVLLEVFAGVLTGLLMGLALYEYRGQLYQGVYLPPFQSLSSAVNYTLVPEVATLCCLAISMYFLRHLKNLSVEFFS
jgi:ABC-type multidrug transport system ATPase subunit